jgi:D-alanyl-lipoteichoic acid acyltransferase DltB (MBOAT superfamily)
MVFSSPIFLFLFAPVLLAVYFSIRVELRNLVLLMASLFFYLWGEWLYVVVLLVSIGLNYVFGLLLDRLPKGGRARGVLVLAVVVNLALIAVFKYAGFFVAEETGTAACAPTSIWWPSSSSAACGTVRAGTSSSGGCSMGHSWLPSGWVWAAGARASGLPCGTPMSGS